MNASADPLATPVSSLPPPVTQLKSEQPIPQKPMYAELLKEMSDEMQQQQTPPPQHEAMPMPMPASSQPPPPQPQPQPQQQPSYYYPPPPPAPAAVTAARPAAAASSLFSPGANKNLAILAVVVAIALKVVAPRMRAYPRFSSHSGIGLSLVGVVALSAGVVVAYRALTYAAGLSA